MSTSSCNFQIMSDLHLETHPSYEYDFPKTAPYLALLGDIGHVATEHLTKFLVRQLLRYRIVFFLLGNHEPYHLSMEFAKEKMSRFARNAKKLRDNDSSIGEFVFLNKIRHDILDSNITVLGCTLFSNVLPEQAADVQSLMVDFRDILHWDVGDHVEAHVEDLQWLNTQVAEVSQLGRRIVIFTHHSPCTAPRAIDPRHRTSKVSSGFATDLSSEECWINRAVVLWGFGHTHYSCDFTEDGKRVVANQKGYYLIPEKAFQPGKVVSVDSDVSEE